MIRSREKRGGFTLIELIVVVGIFIVLASLIVGVAYTANTKDSAATGASNLVGWLKTAQAYALRDQKPYGIRLYVASSTLIPGSQYIEQPPDFVGPPGNTLTSTATVGASQATISVNPPPAGGLATDLSGGWSGTTGTSWTQEWPIGPNDYLEWNGKIGQVAAGPTPPTTTGFSINLWPPDAPVPATGSSWGAPTPVTTANWRIIRQPRIMTGSDPLTLPAGVVIDVFNSNPTCPYYSPMPATPTGNLDILFSPTGAVISPGLQGRDIKFWLRDSTLPLTGNANTFNGNQFIVSIATRTGLISIHPVDVTASAGPGSNYLDPYSFTRDGRSSGQ